MWVKIMMFIIFLYAGLFFSCDCSEHQSDPINELRLSAIPIVTVGSYLSAWSFTDKLYDSRLKHSTGKDFPLLGAIRVDDEVYRFLGVENQENNLSDSISVDENLSAGHTTEMSFFGKTAIQRYVDVCATQTSYLFTCGGVELYLTFTAPLMLQDPDLFSLPVNYITYHILTNDGKSHQVQLYFEVAADCVHNEQLNGSLGESFEYNNLIFMKTGSQNQLSSAKQKNDVCTDRGYFYLVSEKDHTNYSIGSSKQLRCEFVNDQMHEHVIKGENEHSTLAMIKTPGKVFCSTGNILIAYDDEREIDFHGDTLKPYWKRNQDQTLASQFEKANNDYKTIIRKCERFDSRLMNDATGSGCKAYAELCVMAYRQAVSAYSLFKTSDGKFFLLPKNCEKKSTHSIVGEAYLSAPLFLYYNPSVLEGMLNPFLHSAEKEKGNKNVLSFNDGGSILILSAAIAVVEGNTRFALKHWDVLTAWAENLQKDEPNVVASLKTILGIASYAKLAEMNGKDAIAEYYFNRSRELANRWMQKRRDGDLYQSVFYPNNNSDKMYHLVWHKLLNLRIFPDEMIDKEIKIYLSKQQHKGFPWQETDINTLSNNIIWAATLADDNETFCNFVTPLTNFMNECDLNLSDATFADKSICSQFHNRSVAGGYFIRMLEYKLNNNY